MTLTLVIGGARSGKSAYAERLMKRYAPPWRYIATANPLDDEMRTRIARHRDRRDARWETIEAPLYFDSAFAIDRPVLLDCLTVWLGNILHTGLDPDTEADSALAHLAKRSAPTVVVTTEVGQGIVPDNALARQFVDAAGLLHQKFAQVADQLISVVAGYPIIIKPCATAKVDHDD